MRGLWFSTLASRVSPSLTYLRDNPPKSITKNPTSLISTPNHNKARSVKAIDDDYEPAVGSLGKHPDNCGSGHAEDLSPDECEKDPEHGIGDEGLGHDEGHQDPEIGAYGGGKDPEHGIGDEGLGHDEGHQDPEVGAYGGDAAPHIVANALLCLNEKHICSGCEESCRLTASGELHVPPDHVDEFCSGPCLEETNLVLHCIDGIMDHFVFYNKATTQDVRDTILAGCSYGDERGDFDVTEHIEADGAGESIGQKGAIKAVFGIVVTLIGYILLI